MKLSIIVPAYNVERYIEKCLKSCLEQDVSYSDFNIIVVNDGSSDSSVDVAERIAATAENIIVVSQTNKGLSAARNKGLSLATGDYVWFVDSDDWIEENCLKNLFPLLDGTDVIHIGHTLVYSDRVVSNVPKVLGTNEDLIRKGFLRPAPFYVMRRRFLELNDLKFMDGVFHEDTEFTPRMLYLCGTINIYPYPLYHYLQRENSITTTINPKRSFDLLKVAESLFKFRDERVKDNIKPYFNNLIAGCINAALNTISKSKVEDRDNWLTNLKKYRHLLRAMSKSRKIRYKVQGFVFTIVPTKAIIKAYKLMSVLK